MIFYKGGGRKIPVLGEYEDKYKKYGLICGVLNKMFWGKRKSDDFFFMGRGGSKKKPV